MFTLADLTRLSGAKRRTVQLWAEGGALLAEPVSERQGSGVHRVFSRDEAIICLILSRISKALSPPIGRLRDIAKGIRGVLQKEEWERRHIESVIDGNAAALLAVHSDGRVTLLADRNIYALPLEQLHDRNESVVVILLDKALSALRFV